MSAPAIDMSAADTSGHRRTVQQLAGRRRLTPIAACIAPLLDALDWRGSARELSEALSARWSAIDLVDLRNTMANLNYRSWAQRGRLGDIDTRLLPCLFVSDRGASRVLWRGEDGQIAQSDGREEEAPEIAPRERGNAYFFALEEEASDRGTAAGESWLVTVARRFHGAFGHLLASTLILNLLALATPLFVMSVYDRVIGAGDRDALHLLAAGVGLALACDLVIRVLRGLLLAHISGRLDMIVGSSAVGKLLDLPLARLERAAVGTQIARIREFEGLRGFFVGPLALAILESPFVFIFLITIAFIAGWLALVPLGLLLVMGIAGWAVVRWARYAMARSLSGSSDAQTLLVELLNNLSTIKSDGAEHIWMERFRERSTALAMANLRNARIAAVVQTFGHLIMISAGALTLTFGALFVMKGQITVGALIASMALVWRVLSPMQMLFLALTRLSEVRNAISRINQLMALPMENQSGRGGETVTRSRHLVGRVALNRVVMRYAPNQEPALAGISLEVSPGEIVALAGPNGSGKSTILKLVMDLYRPQAGTVMIDGIDVRQLNPHDLRRSIGYMPQDTELFSGTIGDNLRLANPIADERALVQACERAGVLDEVENLPKRFNTRLSEQDIKQISSGFGRGLCLARTFLTEAPIMLFDEPGTALDNESDQAFIRALHHMRGEVTCLVVTHRPSHIRAADRVLVMSGGMIGYDGTPGDMAEVIAGAAQ